MDVLLLHKIFDIIILYSVDNLVVKTKLHQDKQSKQILHFGHFEVSTLILGPPLF